MSDKIVLYVGEDKDSCGDRLVELLFDPLLSDCPYERVWAFILTHYTSPRVEIYSADFFNIASKRFNRSSNEQQTKWIGLTNHETTLKEIFASIGYKFIVYSKEL
jgi:hypothetical protein